MKIIIALFIYFAAAAFACLLYPGKQNLTWPKLLLLGLFGAIVGGLISRLLGGGPGPAGLVTAIVGSFLVLWALDVSAKAAPRADRRDRIDSDDHADDDQPGSEN